MSEHCNGEHRYFAVETVGVETEGKVFVLYLCTACGDFKSHVEVVCPPGNAIRLLNEEKQKRK